MRKKLVVLAMVALVALVAVTPALAGGRDQQFFSVRGTIKDIDIDDNTITVEVEGGSPAVWEYVGKDLPVQVNESTVYFECTEDGRVPIVVFNYVYLYRTTNIQGTVAGDVFTANRVIVKLDP